MRYRAVIDTNVLVSSLLTKRPDAAKVRAVVVIPEWSTISLVVTSTEVVEIIRGGDSGQSRP